MSTAPLPDTEPPNARDGNGETVLFQAELRPNRSSTSRTARRLGVILAITMVPVALGFTLAGAWPVFGFMGLELVALVALLHYNLRRSSVVERVRVTERQVHLERVNPWGRREAWSFPKHWARVKLTGAAADNCRLEIRSHGRVVPLGGFLTADERRQLWQALSRFISALCAPARPVQKPSTSRMV